MPENKKPIFRYLVIDRCIRNTARKYSYEDLLEAVNQDLEDKGLQPIGKTTFYQDIRDLQVEFHAPIDTYWEGGRKIYQYTAEYSFSNQPLNQGELDQIREATHILSRYSGIPGFEWMDAVLPKLELGTQPAGDRNIISFGSNMFLKGKEYIGKLFHAITHRQVIAIRYQTFKSNTEKEHVIHPYHLKEYDNRWYILGYKPDSKDLITLSVDRIQELRVMTDTPYIENSTIDFVDYFDDLIGVWKEKGKKEERIVLKFTPLMAQYVETKPLHGSQKVVRREDDGSLVISLEVIHNYELENLIFYYNNGVEVLEPPLLRTRIKTMIEEMRGFYE